MSYVELFLFILKLPSILNQNIVCRNNDIPSAARARLQESNILIIAHSISFHCWFVRLHAKRPTNVCHVYMQNVWNALFTYGFDSLSDKPGDWLPNCLNWLLICRFWLQCLIPKLSDGVFVIIFIKTIYSKILHNKIIHRFGFCDIRNHHGLGPLAAVMKLNLTGLR